MNRGEYLSFVGVNTHDEITLALENPCDGSRVSLSLALQEDDTADMQEAIPYFDYLVDQPLGGGIFMLRLNLSAICRCRVISPAAPRCV